MNYNINFITTRHKGGGHKRLYRLIDFKQNKLTVKYKVARISLLNYFNQKKKLYNLSFAMIYRKFIKLS